MLRPICLYILFVLLLLTGSDGFSQQLKLGKNPSAVIKSAVLELESTNQGLLFPRLTDTAGINLFLPPDGMVIYLTSAKHLFVRANNRWQALTSGTIDTTNIASFSQKVRGLFGAASPLAFNAATGIFSIPQASSTSAGYLSAADWTTFNNKLSANNVWTRQGNAGTNAGTDFIGTTDNQDLIFKTNSTERWRIENSSGDIKIGSSTSGTFKATKELVMRQDGDTYGSSILRLRNRNAENGAIFETTDPSTTLVDFIFKTAANQRNLRYEARSTYSKIGVPAFHMGGANPDDPTLALADDAAAFRTNLKVGSLTTPAEALDVAGNVRFSGALMPGGSAGTSGHFLKSNGAGSAPTWEAINTGGGSSTSMLSVDRSTSSNSLVNVTGLSFSVTGGKTYKFKFFISYTSSSTSRGSVWSIDGPNNPTMLSYYSNYNTNSTNSITNNQGLDSYDSPSSPNGSSLSGSNIAIIEGIIKPSSSGTIIARFASESSGVITAKAGSYVEFKQLD